jgi:hypothetical protein
MLLKYTNNGTILHLKNENENLAKSQEQKSSNI